MDNNNINQGTDEGISREDALAKIGGEEATMKALQVASRMADGFTVHELHDGNYDRHNDRVMNELQKELGPVGPNMNQHFSNSAAPNSPGAAPGLDLKSEI